MITPKSFKALGHALGMDMSLIEFADPVPSSTGESTGFTAGAGTTATSLSTYTGNVGSTAYTVSDIVKHLKNQGIIAP